MLEMPACLGLTSRREEHRAPYKGLLETVFYFSEEKSSLIAAGTDYTF